jgi:hypothetical protein
MNDIMDHFFLKEFFSLFFVPIRAAAVTHRVRIPAAGGKKLDSHRGIDTIE